jgi:hypothetical protein
VANAREPWNPRLKRAQCLRPTSKRKAATAGEATTTWKTSSAAAVAERESVAPQKKKERILPIVSSVKQGEEKGVETQISPDTTGTVGEKERKEEKREET